MKTGELGKIYLDGEAIIRQGEPGDRMYIVQTGTVAVIGQKSGGVEFHIANLKEGDIFGEMALFEQETRSATVRALGEARVISIDKKGFLRRVHEDPSLAYRLMQQMSQRIRRMNVEIARLKGKLARERRSFKENRTAVRRNSPSPHAASGKRAGKDRRFEERRTKFYSLAESA